VNSANQRSQIVEIFEVCNSEATDTYDSKTRHEYLALKLAGLREAPVQFSVFTDQNVAEGRGLGRGTMSEMLFYSTVMTIHTLWLAARAESIGLGWVGYLFSTRTVFPPRLMFRKVGRLPVISVLVTLKQKPIHPSFTKPVGKRIRGPTGRLFEQLLARCPVI